METIMKEDQLTSAEKLETAIKLHPKFYFIFLLTLHKAILFYDRIFYKFEDSSPKADFESEK